MKDLPDLAILASLGTLDSDVLRTAVKQTFVHRSTHEVPRALDRPREQWRLPYERLASLHLLCLSSLPDCGIAQVFARIYPSFQSGGGIGPTVGRDAGIAPPIDAVIGFAIYN